LPQEVLLCYQQEREALVVKAERDGHELSWFERKRLFELYSEKVQSYLDAGYGDCWLKDERFADLVVAALKFFDQQRYELSAWVAMPNHVHAIVRPLSNHLLHEIVKSWKGYTGREANKLLHRSGDGFWEREYYDHVLRDDKEKAVSIAYIHDNPVKAGLCSRPEDWKWSSAYKA
jgi:putative DNA methylase